MFGEITYQLKITNKCNLKCPYCFTKLSDDIMSIEIIKSLLNKSRGYNRINLIIIGGEPLLIGEHYLSDLKHIIDSHIKETHQDVKTHLCTNGVLLNYNHFQYVDSISVSYDGYKLGHKGNNKIRKNIQQFANKIATIDVVITDKNYQKLQSIYDELESFGIRRMTVNFDINASHNELIMYFNALKSINYRKAKTRIMMIDNINKMQNHGHRANVKDFTLENSNVGSCFAIEPNGDLSMSIINTSPNFGNINQYSHIYDVMITPKYIETIRKYISQTTNHLIQGSFHDTMHRFKTEMKSVLNNKEVVIC